MSTSAGLKPLRPAEGRSQRDELERLQEALRDARYQHEELPRENAELTAQVARLEEEVRSLQKARDAAHAEWSMPQPSLPEQLVPPFCAAPSRRTVYGRALSSLRQVNLFQLIRLHLWLSVLLAWFYPSTPLVGALFLSSFLLGFTLFYIIPQTHEAGDEHLLWSFDDEGFTQISSGDAGKVLYAEVRKVEVIQGWLQRRWGFGSVRVTWVPTKSTSLGKAAGGSTRVADIRLLDDPARLAGWLLERMKETSAEKPGGAHAG